ncbi:MAG: rhodanese-like domain-containing protein [Chitinophagales bacterium]|nr:rhodanese-like domain-containing protein [Bacteroidota bacterium]MCB9043518.1 rhodanese-like domain-containing protein [Chitinophagales bacterium]
MKQLFFLCVLATISFMSCQSEPTETKKSESPEHTTETKSGEVLNRDFNTMEVAELKQVLDNNSDNIILVDVRTPEEVAQGIIDGAKVIDFSSSDFGDQIKQLPEGKKVIMYCAVGGRSARACAMLSGTGRGDVYNLRGGIEAWKRAGYPLAK